MASKRPRAEAGWTSSTDALKTPAALSMLDRLCREHPLGLQASRVHKNSFAEQMTTFKRRAPARLIISRVAEQYEALGIDAVALVEHSDCQPAKGEVVRVSFHRSRLQSVLTALVRAGLTAAVYEESKVLRTPRQRELAQVVSRATPLYAPESGTADAPEDNDVPSALPIVLVRAGDGGVEVVSADLQAQTYSVLSEVPSAVARAVALTALPPVFHLGRAPGWDDVSMRELGAGAVQTASQRLLDLIEESYEMATCNFRRLPASEDACAPLAYFTAHQLGLLASGSVPSLAQSCLSLRASKLLSEELRCWMMRPPSRAVANARRAILQHGCAEAVPILEPARAGSRRRLIASGCASGRTLRAVGRHARALKSSERLAAFAVALGRAGGCELDSVHLGSLAACVERWVLPEAVELGGVVVEVVRTEKLDALLRAHAVALGRVEGCLANYDPGEVVRSGDCVALRGRADGKEKKAVHDRGGRPVPQVHTTEALSRAVEAAQRAEVLVRDAQARELALCASAVREDLLDVAAVAEEAVLALAVLFDHAATARARGWVCAIAGSEFRCRGLRPYWMEGARANAVDVEGVTILTAPNGGGKTTLLRSLGAAALLSQCGLFVPADHAEIPGYAHIFIRAGAEDCASEGRSAFANEMYDMRGMLDAGRDALLLVDEPCRGTSTADGVRLLGAIVDHLDQEGMTAVISTHYHELEATGARTRFRQLGVRADGCRCVPDFALTSGRCTDSMALRIAIAAGLPLAIVRAARSVSDTLTLVHAVLSERGLPYLTLTSEEHPPPEWACAVYVLPTRGGVYVGESERIKGRLTVQRRSKDHSGDALVVRRVDKSEARALEAVLIRAFQAESVAILSSADGSHRA